MAYAPSPADNTLLKSALNADGFYEPHITNSERCTNCSLCMEVCSYSHDGLSLTDACIKSYAAMEQGQGCQTEMQQWRNGV